MVYDIRKERLKMQNSCVRVKERRKMPIQKMMRGTILRKGKNEFLCSACRAELSLETLGNGTRHQSVRCLQDGAWKNLCYGRDRGGSASAAFQLPLRNSAMNSVIAGFGTKDGTDGGGLVVKYNGRLPEYYISWEEMYARGYKPGKPPRKYAPDMMIYGGVYSNE